LSHDDEQTNPPTPMCHVQYRIALSKQCSAANRVSGLEKIGLEFLQNYKVEKIGNASFFLIRLYNLFDPFIFILHIPPPN